MEITDNKDGTYSVQSPSGNTYTVKRCLNSDGDPEYPGLGPEFIALWECNCPAGTYRGTCKHINAVSQFCEAQDA